MAGSPGVRRVLLVNALIFAVLAAAVALAYYGYSYTSEVSSHERELAVLQELADDKVLDIESRIESSDNQLLARGQIEPRATRVSVPDDQRPLVPDGPASPRLGKPGIAFRDKILARIVPDLPLAKQPV